jgi:hypothetical protein
MGFSPSLTSVPRWWERNPQLFAPAGGSLGNRLGNRETGKPARAQVTLYASSCRATISERKG